jgi:hypothetical protein
MKEKTIYEIIKRLVDTNGNKKRAAIRLGCTERYVNKLIIKYKNEGKAGFIHKNSGRQPKATISKETKDKILKLYEDEYYDYNWTHFTEKLNEDENIKITYTPLRHILTSAGYISPLCNRSTRRAKKKELEAKKRQLRQEKKEAEAKLKKFDKQEEIILGLAAIPTAAEDRPNRIKAIDSYFNLLNLFNKSDASGEKKFSELYNSIHPVTLLFGYVAEASKYDAERKQVVIDEALLFRRVQDRLAEQERLKAEAEETLKAMANK